MKARIGRVHLWAGSEYDLDEIPSLPYGLLLLVRRYVFGAGLAGTYGNPYLSLYGGVVAAEVYYDRDGSHKDEQENELVAARPFFEASR